MPPAYDVVAIGLALTDIVARVDERFLSTHGVPLGGGRRFDPSVIASLRASLDGAASLPGGAAANTVATLAALGGRAGFFGKVGADADGEAFLADFERRGVASKCAPSEAGPSGTCLVLLTGEDRSFALNFGCAPHFSAEDFDGFDFSDAAGLLVEANLIAHPDCGTHVASAVARAAHATQIVVNLQGVRNLPSKPGLAKAIADLADLVVGNDSETPGYVEGLAANGIRAKEGQVVVTTMAERGAMATDGKSSWRVPAATPSTFASTVGAGDGFLAGLLYGLSRSPSKDIEGSLRLAAATAAAVIAEIGPRPTSSLRHLVPG